MSINAHTHILPYVIYKHITEPILGRVFILKEFKFEFKHTQFYFNLYIGLNSNEIKLLFNLDLLQRWRLHNEHFYYLSFLNYIYKDRPYSTIWPLK